MIQRENLCSHIFPTNDKVVVTFVEFQLCNGKLCDWALVKKISFSNKKWILDFPYKEISSNNNNNKIEKQEKNRKSACKEARNNE